MSPFLLALDLALALATALALARKLNSASFFIKNYFFMKTSTSETVEAWLTRGTELHAEVLKLLVGLHELTPKVNGFIGLALSSTLYMAYGYRLCVTADTKSRPH